MAHSRNGVNWLATRLVVFVYVLNVGVVGDWIVLNDECTTPDGGFGDCVPIKECKTIIDFIEKSAKPLSESVKKKLSSYRCKTDTDDINVCCPYSPIKIEEKGPPDVSNHRNINLLPQDCGYQPSDFKIINGQNTLLNEFPWMALLKYNTKTGPEFKCGGTIINERWILTAAHCVTNLKESLINVRVGEHNILTERDCEEQENGITKCSEAYDVSIEKVIPHPAFNITIINNDIALMKVDKMNLNSENVRPVCLPLGDTRNAKFSKFIVTGWGITNTGRPSDILQKVSVGVISPEECQFNYRKNSNVRITENQICAGGKKKDSCPGDSGGPLHMSSFLNNEPRYVQQGIVSFGPRECGLEDFPGVYTRVAYYMDWILDNITA